MGVLERESVLEHRDKINMKMNCIANKLKDFLRSTFVGFLPTSMSTARLIMREVKSFKASIRIYLCKESHWHVLFYCATFIYIVRTP